MELYCINKTEINTLKRITKVYKYVLSAILVWMLVGSAFAQSDSVTLHLSDTDLETAFSEIRSQTDVSFIFNNEELSDAPKVSVSLENVSIEKALVELLKNTGLTFEKINNTIVIKPVKKNLGSAVPNEEVIKQTVRGIVLDKDSKSGLPFATVQILNTDPAVGTTTDVDGKFAINNVPVGRYTVKVSYVGYADGYIPSLMIGSGKETVITVELTEQVQSLGEIVVTATNGQPVNDMAVVNAIPFDAEETKRYAATIGDPARMAQVLPGVSGTDDASNEIAIRGNSPNWLLWRVEGVEIPGPNHFAEEGYGSGAVSILSVNMLGASDFYTGAFPAEYGNALSGVFDIKLRNGNNQEHEYTAQVGVLGLEFAAEGPFKKGYDGSFLFNYRYSTLSLLSDIGVEISDNTIGDYQDLSFKLNLPTKKAGTFALWGLGGNSVADEKYLPDTTLGEDLENGYIDYTKYGMAAAGLSHTLFTDKKSYIHSVFAVSNSSSSQNFEEADSLGVIDGSFFDDLNNNAFRFNSYYNRKLNDRTTMRAGVMLSRLNYNYLSKDHIDSTNTWNTFINSNGTTNLYQAFAQAKYKFSNTVIFTGGLNYTYFALNGDNSLEPRLGLEVLLPKMQKLGFGYGKHTRTESLPVYFVETFSPEGEAYLPNKDLKLTRAHHFVASYQKLINDNILVKAEAYYQFINDLPVANNPDKYWSPIFGGVDPYDTLSNIGKGRNYGLELTIQKYFGNQYYFLVTSSLFDSKYKPADGQWHDTKYNINYINNFVGGKEFKWGDNKMLGLNAKVIWSGGKRLVPINLNASIEEGKAVYESDLLFTEKAEDYARLDIGIRLHFFSKKTEQVISLDVQNVTNRLNTWFHTYDAKNESIINYPMAGIIPILSYRVEF